MAEDTNTTLVKKQSILPPQVQNDNENSEVNIIKGLSFNDRVDEICFELYGWRRNPTNDKDWELTQKAIMNDVGIDNFRQVCRSITEKVYTMGHLKEKQVTRIIVWFVLKNMAHFQVYHKDFGLARCNFNIIHNYLMTVAFGGTTKALNAGDRNVVRGTYSEDLLGKYYANQGMAEGGEKKKGLFSWLRRK